MREQWRTGWRKWTLISVAGLSAVLLTMLGALESGVLNSPILWLVGQVSGYELSCSRLSGSLLSRLSCQNLALADQRGVFLTARKLVLDWNGAAVLANRIEIHKLSLTDSRLTRLPKSGKTNADHVLPSIAIAIGRIDIQHFVLENFKGPPACVDLEGRAAAGPNGFDTDLKLVRCHPLSGQLVLRGHYVKATGNVMLHATAHDDGRALVQLLGLKRVGPARLSVQLAGTLPALSGRVHLSLGAIGVFDARLRAMDASRTLVDSRFHVASGVLPDFTPHADGRISATVSYAPRQGFLVRPLTAVWGSLSANGEVGADAAGRLRGHITVTSSGTQTISGTRIGSVSLDLNLGGSDTSPALSGTATLRDIASAKAMLARITAKLTAARTTDGTLSLGIAGEASGTRLPAPVAGLIGGRFKFAAQVERAAGGQLTLTGSLTGNAAHAQWTATLGTMQGSGALTLRIPDLARAGTGFGGSALARLTLDRLTLGGTLHGTIQIEGHAITASGFGYALGHAPRLSAQIAARDGSYRLSALRFDLATLSAHGALSLARSGALAADITVTRGELAPLAPLLGRSLAGSFTLRARASGTWQSPVIAVDATSAELRVGSNVLRQVRLAATAQNQSGWRGRLRLAAATTIGAINLASVLDMHAQGWSLSVARGEIGPARLAGAIAMNRGTYSGALILKGDLLAPVGLLLGQQAAGVGTLRVQGLGRALQVSADIRQMSVASLKGASLKALVTLQDGAGPVRLMVRLRDGTNALLARAQARLTPLAIQLNALQGTWAGFDFNLRTPTSVTREQGRFQLARTMLSVSGGDLVVTARGDTKTLNAHLQLTKLPVAPLAAMLQVHHASGMLAASLNVAL
ncbi:MAG: hypothetical protein KGO02_04745, partial [Alphaproteobacteria bacterium]|nr:hypothetical protein [Alphaproteobacteria bacterium]